MRVSARVKVKGFHNKPARCVECKAARKARLEKGGGSGNGREGDSQLE